jgi:hypothetical protein
MQKPHPTPERPTSDRRRIGWALALATVFLSVLVLVPSVETQSARRTDVPARPPGAATGAAEPDPAAASGREALPARTVGPRRTFAEFVAELVRLGLETARAVAANDLAAAEASDRQARRLFDELLQQIPDVGPPALALYLDQPIGSTDDADRMRQTIARLCIEAALSAMHAAGPTRRNGLDAFVGAMLAALPGGAQVARDLGSGLLVDKPYLGVAHEVTLLELSRLAAEDRFSVEIAAALLTTLWRNLEAAGIRDRGQLASLAMLMLQSGTPSEIIAACRTLLADARFRDLVIDCVRNKKDRALAQAVAMAAAEGLAAREALPVIRTMHALSSSVTAALIALGSRDPAALQDAYELALADDVGADFRSELVSGAGFATSAAGLELARLALMNDPARSVRERAMFVLTARAAEAAGEQAIATLLDDPLFVSDPRHLGAAVSALANLESAGLIQAIDRLGQRLTNLPLRDFDRERLQQILARALPGGATSAPR